MKITVKSLARLGLLPLLAILSAGPVSAQTDLGKTILEKLTSRVAKLESACAKDIKKYCKTVTPGEGRMIYCMQAHEDKISVNCTFELGEAAEDFASWGVIDRGSHAPRRGHQRARAHLAARTARTPRGALHDLDGCAVMG